MAGQEVPANNDGNEFNSKLSPQEQAIFDAIKDDVNNMPPQVGGDNETSAHRSIDENDKGRTTDHLEDVDWGVPPKGIGQ